MSEAGKKQKFPIFVQKSVHGSSDPEGTPDIRTVREIIQAAGGGALPGPEIFAIQHDLNGRSVARPLCVP